MSHLRFFWTCTPWSFRQLVWIIRVTNIKCRSYRWRTLKQIDHCWGRYYVFCMLVAYSGFLKVWLRVMSSTNLQWETRSVITTTKSEPWLSIGIVTKFNYISAVWNLQYISFAFDIRVIVPWFMVRWMWGGGGCDNKLTYIHWNWKQWFIASCFDPSRVCFKCIAGSKREAIINISLPLH